ncbi:hypothetical protein F4780DRAFT_745161 [Xylariomycetidae sp. FL0641]|nr:hypothetical protein F4780DRAFT_745161 [Xylariomycetidae sp. FL0641]
MSKSLFLSNSAYRATIRRLDTILHECPDPPSWTLEEQILAEQRVSRMHEAAISQPTCTAVQIGLVDLLRTVRVELHAVIGHSSGEIAAAYAAQRISDRDAILISYYRGMYAYLASGPQGQEGGMMAVGMSESEAVAFCSEPPYNGAINVAASNSPSSVTLSGDISTISQAEEVLKAQGRFVRTLRVDTAYHSPHMLKPAKEYLAALARCGISPLAESNGKAQWVSSVRGYSKLPAKALCGTYWADNMAHPVQFQDATEQVLSGCGPFSAAVEVGPHAALKGPFSQTAKALGKEIPYFGMLERRKDDSQAFAEFLGSLWSAFDTPLADVPGYVKQCTVPQAHSIRARDLPAYPFDHSTTHYRESRLSHQYHSKDQAPHELLGVRTRDDNEHEMRWRNILHADKIEWLEHHSFQGQALLPASAYCVMALDAASYLLNGRPATIVELQDLEIMSGINIDKDSPGVEIIFSLRVLPAQPGNLTASFTLTSCPADGTTKMKKCATGTLKMVLGEPESHVLPSRQASEAETLPANPEMFYKMMDQTGLVYTGPYRAISTIQRRQYYCSATLQRYHPLDTTMLQISPATLDSCFQSAFLSYASPGDQALWTSFLPTRIERVQFNLATCRPNLPSPRDDTLTVDTHLTQCSAASQKSKSTFVVDIGIFNDACEQEIQIEGLAVCALANTQPKDDYELYLQTVTDLDPTDEIVSANTNEVRERDLYLVENCERVASFFHHRQLSRRQSGSSSSAGSRDWYLASMTDNGWPHDTRESIEKLIASSSYRSCLQSIRDLGDNDPSRLAASLDAIVEEAHQTYGFYQHVGRIMKQISHRYPRMNILDITATNSGFLQHALLTHDLPFLSLIVGSQPGESTDRYNRHPELLAGNVKVLPLTVMKDLRAQLGIADPLDLVLLSTSFLEDKAAVDILKNIRSTMRPGAFLILVKTCDGSLAKPSRSVVKGAMEVPSPPVWPDILDSCGFIQQARCSDQFHQSGRYVLVRQLANPKQLTHPSDFHTDLDHLLLIGGSRESCGDGPSVGLQQLLSPWCRRIAARQSFDALSEKDLKIARTVIILADLDEDLMAAMTAHRLDQLRELLRPNMTVLWVTCDARAGNPHHAATFGFARTIAAEVPNLALQVLDLDRVDESSLDLISTTFLRLIHSQGTNGHYPEAPKSSSKESSAMKGEDAHHEPLWTPEAEIHIENGRRLIPRVVPFKEGNDRLNAMRRPVTRSVNTLHHAIQLVSDQAFDGSFRAEFEKTETLSVDTPEGHVSIEVEYGSVEPVRLNAEVSAHVCLGRVVSTGLRVVALSDTHSSYIACPSNQAYALPECFASGPEVVHYMVRFLTFLGKLDTIRDRRIVLIDPPVDFTECVLSAYLPPKSKVASYFTQESRVSRIADSVYVHPRSSARDIKKLFPDGGAIIFSFLPENDELSQLLQVSLPSDCDLYPRGSLLGSPPATRRSNFKSVRGIWERSLLMTLQKAACFWQSKENLDMVSTSGLLQLKGPIKPFLIMDWKADRYAVQNINHLVQRNIFNPQNTYLLIGLTRDLGQSLCRLFIRHGARNIVLASRNPNTSPKWIKEIKDSDGADVRIEKVDVTILDSVVALKSRISKTMPPVGGVINGAMVLEDRVFAQMTIDTWNRVLLPKTLGSTNLDIAFSDQDLDFFMMTSSFAAIGGHPGQSNYAVANMYMNGLAANRRRRGLAGSVLNIGVIYGIGFLQRENKDYVYAGLEREGYPPVSEHDIHHMVLEGIMAGRPKATDQLYDITAGLSRFNADSPNLLSWQLDPRFNHFAIRNAVDDLRPTAEKRVSLKERIAALGDVDAVAETILDAFAERLEALLQTPKDTISQDDGMSSLGVDSLVAVEIRNWIWKTLGKDVPVMKVLGVTSLQKFARELAEQFPIENGGAEPASEKSASSNDGDGVSSDNVAGGSPQEYGRKRSSWRFGIL